MGTSMSGSNSGHFRARRAAGFERSAKHSA